MNRALLLPVLLLAAAPALAQAVPPAAQQDRATGGQEGDRQSRQGVESRGDAAPATTGSTAPVSEAERHRTTGGQDGDRQSRQGIQPATEATGQGTAPR